MGPNVFVGCGGSGIGALRRLHTLLCEDRHWRKRMDEDVYYVVVDTEMAEIRDFQEFVRRQARGARSPFVISIPLSQGVSSLQLPVREAFGGLKAPDVITDAPEQRHMRHWWHHPVTRDWYIASRLTEPLTKGAGQCPSISFFLAWRLMPRIDETMRTVIDEIIKRRRGLAPLEHAAFHVVAGLGGGTGRGCWNLLAFKLRQFMEGRLGDKVKVTAHLFDVSISKDRLDQRPDNRVAMHVNSLTGLSELTCWMRNDGDVADYPEPHLYRLPNLLRPEDPESDVLVAHLELNAGYGAKPVDYACLVFGGSDVAVLDKHEQYIEMLGTSLYANTTLDHIGKTNINDTIRRYRGVGAAAFEISASSIRRYFEQQVRLRLLASLTEADAASVQTRADRLLTEAGLLIELRRDRRGAYRADSHGDLLQRALDRLNGRLRGRLDNLDAAIRDDDPDEVQRCLETVGRVNAADAVVAVSEALDSLAGGGVHGGTALDKVRRVFEAGLVTALQDTLSLQAIEDLFAAIGARLTETLTELPEPSDLELGEGIMQVFERTRRREGLLGLFGRHFSDEEREELMQAARRHLAVTHYEALRQALRECLESLQTPFATWVKAATAARTRLQSVRAIWEDELRRDMGASSGGDPYDSLFTDPRNPTRGLPDKFAAAAFVRRELRPALAREEERALLNDALAVARREELAALLVRVVTDPSHSLAADDPDRRRRFEADLGDVVRRAATLPPNFVDRHFAFRGVIDGLRRAWLSWFERVQSDEDHLNEAIEQFSAFFGVRPRRRGQEFELPELRDIVLGMAASLARTCQPYWRSVDKGNTAEALAVFLPHLGESLDPGATERTLNELIGAERPATVVLGSATGDDDAHPSNPYILLAYALSGVNDLDQVESARYYNDPELKTWLERCEDPVGSAWFEVSGGMKGLGYTDAIYLREPQLSAQRWRPWISGETVDQRAEGEALDALLYGLLTPTEELASSLDTAGWELPLIREQRNRNWVFMREAALDPATTWPRDHRFSGDPRHWSAGDRAGQGLHRVYEALCGRGEGPRQGKSDWKQWRAVIASEASVFWDRVATEFNAGPGSGNYRALLRAQEAWLLSRIREESADSPDRGLLERLLGRVNELAGGVAGR